MYAGHLKGEFFCRRCGACCRIEGIVRLKDGDVAKIAAHLGMSEDDFIANDTDLAPNRQGLILKDRPDGACAMLDGQNRCRIYPVRPEKCRTFPYEWTNDESTAYCPALAALAAVGTRKVNGFSSSSPRADMV